MTEIKYHFDLKLTDLKKNKKLRVVVMNELI